MTDSTASEAILVVDLGTTNSKALLVSQTGAMQRAPSRMRILGVPGCFAPTGSTAWLLQHFGLTAEGIAAAAREIFIDNRDGFCG